MDLKSFFAPEIGIRLTHDLDGFVCTVRRNLFRKDSTTFSIDSSRSLSPEFLLRSALRNPSYPVLVLRRKLKDPQS